MLTPPNLCGSYSPPPGKPFRLVLTHAPPASIPNPHSWLKLTLPPYLAYTYSPQPTPLIFTLQPIRLLPSVGGTSCERGRMVTNKMTKREKVRRNRLQPACTYNKIGGWLAGRLAGWLLAGCLLYQNKKCSNSDLVKKKQIPENYPPCGLSNDKKS